MAILAMTSPARAAPLDSDLPPLSPLTAPAGLSAPSANLPHMSALLIYLAKGPENSCGPGCDRWIAMEGNIDREAAIRAAAVLRGVKDMRRPIYFHSPGGIVDASFEIGKNLRARRAIGRVGQTVVQACGANQIDENCRKIKTGGGELEATIRTDQSICVSACVNMLIGALTREVAPTVGVGVHDSKMFFEYRVEPTAHDRALAEQRSVARARRETSAYVTSMGISSDLIELTRSVPFETARFLTRSEMYRFGIDKRTFVETPWQVVMLPKAHVRKVALARHADGVFRQLELQLHCKYEDQGNLIFTRERAGAVPRGRPFKLSTKSDEAKTLAAATVDSKIEIWQASVFEVEVFKWAAYPQLKLAETATEGDASRTSYQVDTQGLADGWKTISAVCPKYQKPQPKPMTGPPIAVGKPISDGGFGGIGSKPRTVVWPDPPTYAPRQ